MSSLAICIISLQSHLSKNINITVLTPGKNEWQQKNIKGYEVRKSLLFNPAVYRFMHDRRKEKKMGVTTYVQVSDIIIPSPNQIFS